MLRKSWHIFRRFFCGFASPVKAKYAILHINITGESLNKKGKTLKVLPICGGPLAEWLRHNALSCRISSPAMSFWYLKQHSYLKSALVNSSVIVDPIQSNYLTREKTEYLGTNIIFIFFALQLSYKCILSLNNFRKQNLHCHRDTNKWLH